MNVLSFLLYARRKIIEKEYSHENRLRVPQKLRFLTWSHIYSRLGNLTDITCIIVAARNTIAEAKPILLSHVFQPMLRFGTVYGVTSENLNY